MQRETTDLSSRVALLERRVARLSALTFLSVSTLMIVSFCSLARAQSKQLFEVKDEKGSVVVDVKSVDDRVGLSIYNRRGIRTAVIGDTGGKGGLMSIFNDEGFPVAGISPDDKGGCRLSIYDSKGKVVFRK